MQETQSKETISCEFCGRDAKYTVKVTDSSSFYDGGSLHCRELIRPRCAYHKISSRHHYETETNSHQKVTQEQLRKLIVESEE